ncbi:Uncharacterized protein DAT39_023429 [Clarias magur]|uniref:Uncharacterized protein n=1 Tax=Clarias magur TaxID=1594786 RepID=A0A8J4X740_CLAMG|nr:Uncharacterized protein DAT39_023429 [Clarias magur]
MTLELIVFFSAAPHTRPLTCHVTNRLSHWRLLPPRCTSPPSVLWSIRSFSC